MTVKNAKMYPLTDGKYIVSYFDPIRKKRIQKNFDEEAKAKTFLVSLKTPTAKLSELSYLKTASTETAVRVYLESVPNASLKRSGRLIREFLEFFSTHGVPRLTEESLRAFFTYQKQEMDLADRTLLYIKSQLQGFFKFLIEQGAITKSPLDNIKFDRGALYTKKPTIFDKKAMKELIATANKLSPAFFYPIFILIDETAARFSDVLALQWKDVNFKERRIELSRSTEVRARSFQMSDRLIEALNRIDKISDHVMTNLDGRPLHLHSIGRELKQFQRLAGYSTKWTLKDLRSSFGYNFLKNGGSIEELQKIMGHRSKQTTQDLFQSTRSFKTNILDSVAVQETGDICPS